jgi:AraC-like DNA-binding protein
LLGGIRLNAIRLYEQKHLESYAIHMHDHGNYQILYALEGKGVIRLDDVRVELVPDSVAVVFPHTRHAVASETHLTLLVLEFEEEGFADKVAAYWKNVFDRSAVLKLNLFHAGEMRTLLRKLLFAQQDEQELSAWAMRIYWLEVLLLLAQVKKAKPMADANAFRAERIRQYIDTHYYLPLTLNHIAQQLGVSTRHATAIFKEKYHMTPMQYVAEARVSVAKKLLLETDKDIISIGFEVGYESLTTFYRVFKSHAMMTPSQFRQQRSKEL